MALVFIFKRSTFLRRGNRYSRIPRLLRGSSEIRGMQMAEYLGGKINPAEREIGDVRIILKPYNLDFVNDGDYVDIIDGYELIQKLEQRPGVNAIFCSEYFFKIFSKELKNKCFLIPQHHCNFENIVRDRTDVNTVGYIGNDSGLDIPIDELSANLKSIGIDLLINKSYSCREDIVDFYKKIDIQINFPYARKIKRTPPLKIINAGSFGIPTISLECDNYSDVSDIYEHIKSYEDIIPAIKKLKSDKKYYDELSKKLIDMAKDYHISNIAELYKKLL